VSTVDRLLGHLEAHEPASPLEAASLRRMLALVRWLPRPLDETADPMHVTASAIVVDGAGHVVMHRHKRLGIWLQPGGHVDPGETPEGAVVREVEEETGARATHLLDDRPLHVDVHEGPRGHVHLDVRYLLRLDPGTPFRPAPDESQAVRWMPYAEAASRGDRSVADAVDAARRAVERGVTA
jgi:ADP-ribose pyrophosphatase YjhB (NUDIX family)